MCSRFERKLSYHLPDRAHRIFLRSDPTQDMSGFTHELDMSEHGDHTFVGVESHLVSHVGVQDAAGDFAEASDGLGKEFRGGRELSERGWCRCLESRRSVHDIVNLFRTD